jgi:hypothetical protein
LDILATEIGEALPPQVQMISAGVQVAHPKDAVTVGQCLADLAIAGPQDDSRAGNGTSVFGCN